jgi:hypothetical protein
MATIRRSLKLSLPPLWLMGVCLFLPAVRSCEKLESPAQLLSDSKPLFAMMLSPYVLAQLLVVVAVVALARNRVSPFVSWATAALAGLSASSAGVLAVLGFDGHDLRAQLWRFFAAVCLAVGVIVFARALKREEWTRLQRLHVAYTIFTLPMAALLARIVVGDGPHRVGVGAWLFLAAYAALVVVHARELLSSRRDRLRS